MPRHSFQLEAGYRFSRFVDDAGEAALMAGPAGGLSADHAARRDNVKADGVLTEAALAAYTERVQEHAQAQHAQVQQASAMLAVQHAQKAQMDVAVAWAAGVRAGAAVAAQVHQVQAQHAQAGFKQALAPRELLALPGVAQRSIQRPMSSG